jgi:hypothetical protein
MIEAGATRIGASAGVRIVHGNGSGPERGYGGEAVRAVADGSSGDGQPDVPSTARTTVIARPRARIHRL